MSPRPQPFGPYVRLARLGKGAAGSAYLARPYDEAAGVPTPFVLKLLHASHVDRSDFLERFLHEAQVAVSVDSPHVASVFDVGQVGDSYYIALEYVPGWTYAKVLASLRERREGAPLPVVHRLLADAARGLGALHDARTADGHALDAVHRDVSPKNLMVAESGAGFVIDLGLTKSRAQEYRTEAGRVMGSPGYMAPEQIRAQRLDRRVDLYALAVIGWELVTGARWVPVAEPLDMLRQALRRPFEAPSSLRAKLTPEIDLLFRQALDAEPAARFSDAEAFVQALEATLPRAASDREVQVFLRELIPGDFEARRREVERVLRLPLPEAPEHQATVVYVRRPGVQPEPDGVEVAPTRVVGVPLAAAAGPEPTATRPVPPPTPAPPPPVARGERGGSAAPMTGVSWSASFTGGKGSPLAFAAVVLLALGVGFGAGAWFFQRRGPARAAPVEAITPAEPVEPVAPPPAPRSTPGAVARPRPEAAPAPPEPKRVEPTAPAVKPAADDVPAAAPRARRAPRRPDPAPAPAKPAGVEARAARLQKAALALKQQVGAEDPRAGAIDLLLARLAMLKAAGLGEAASSQVAGLERELAALRAR